MQQKKRKKGWLQRRRQRRMGGFEIVVVGILQRWQEELVEVETGSEQWRVALQQLFALPELRKGGPERAAGAASRKRACSVRPSSITRGVA